MANTENDKLELGSEADAPTPIDETIFRLDEYVEPVPDQTKILLERAFIGKYTLESICDGIHSQFSDYINLEDPENYVEIFYDQLSRSYQDIKLDESLENPTETKEALGAIHDGFVNMMAILIDTHLGIGINGFDEEHLSAEELQYIISRVYEYFILGATRNFKVVISKEAKVKLQLNSETYFQDVQEIINKHDPLITTITPEEFILYTGDREILKLYQSNQIVGNFLMKYSPKLFKSSSSEFRDELTNYITAYQTMGQSISSQSSNNIPSEINEEKENGL